MTPSSTIPLFLLSLTLLSPLTTAKYCDKDESSPTPSQVLNLSSFILQEPCGSKSCNVDDLDHYHDDHFFCSSSSRVSFCVNLNDPTTSGSHYPRSELRQNSKYDWYPGDTYRTMNATCKVRHVPSKKPRTVIGQIHGDCGNEFSQLLKLEWNDNKVEAHVKNKDQDEISLNLGSYKLGDELKYFIALHTSLTLDITVNDHKTSYDYSFLPSSVKKSKTFYWKAGNYCQYESSSSSDGCLVDFYYVKTNTKD